MIVLYFKGYNTLLRFDAFSLFPMGLCQVYAVYANSPTTIDERRTNIKIEIAAVTTDLCFKTVENWVQRLDFCKRARGVHAKEIEFHTKWHRM